MVNVHKGYVSSVLAGLQCFENRKILPFWAILTRKYSDVVSGRLEKACSSGDTQIISWQRNCQRETKPVIRTSRMSHQNEQGTVNLGTST